MNYKLKVNDKICPVMAEELEDKKLKVIIDDNEYNVSCSRVSHEQLHLNVNGKLINVYLDKDNNSIVTVINGTPYVINDANELEGNKKSKKVINKNDSVTPPTPSVVVKVLVKEGDTVSSGQGVVVVSAMKLETTLPAPFNGTVSSINVSEGDKVKPGQVLVDIIKNSEKTHGEENG